MLFLQIVIVVFFTKITDEIEIVLFSTKNTETHDGYLEEQFDSKKRIIKFQRSLKRETCLSKWCFSKRSDDEAH